MASFVIPENTELAAELEANARACAEWLAKDEAGIIRALHAAKAESERLGNHEPLERFVRKLKAGGFHRHR
jgi:hypothetical protein